MKKLLFSLLLAGMTAAGFAQEANDKFVPTQEELAKYLPELTVGDTVPELTGRDPEGKLYDLARLRGNYVVIDFWASWCGDCRREIPGLRALYAETKDYKPDALDIVWVGFSFDYNADAWNKLLEKEQLPWLQISNLKRTREDPTFSRWKLHWIPAFFVVDPEGVIIGTAITADGLREVLRSKLLQ